SSWTMAAQPLVAAPVRAASSEMSFAGGQVATLRRADRAAEMVLPTAAAPGRGPLPGGRAPRGSYLWPRAAGFSPTAASGEFVVPGAATAETVEQAAPGRPLWEAMRTAMVPLAVSDSRPRDIDPDVELARPFLQLVQGGVTSS